MKQVVCIVLWSLVFCSSVLGAAREKLVLLPLQGKGLSVAEKKLYQGAIKSELSKKYKIYSGEEVEAKLKKFAITSCSSDECLEQIAIAFNGHLVGRGYIIDSGGIPLLGLEVRDIFTNEDVFSESAGCEGCNGSGIIRMFKVMAAGRGTVGAGAVAYVSSSAAAGPVSGGVVRLTPKVTDKSGSKVAALFFDSEPSGATVYLGDTVAGVTPYQNFSLKPGQTIQVMLRKKGCHDKRVEVTLSSGTNNLGVLEMKTKYGQLSIASVPSGADVIIAGKKEGTTPYTDSRMLSGAYLVSLRKDLYSPLENQRVVVKDGQKTMKTFTLEANFGSLSIDASPLGVSYILSDSEGERIRTGTTPDIVKAAPGFYTLKLEKPGYAPLSFEVTLARNDKQFIDKKLAVLRKLQGELIITSEPYISGAGVFVDGKGMGSIPLTVNLAAGVHEVEVNTGEKVGRTKVTVKDGDSVVVKVPLDDVDRMDRKPHVLKLALDWGPVSFDPHVELSGGMLQYSHMVFDPLVRWTQNMEFEPRLATKWERIDNLTMRFYLRKGVKFHSGNLFTAKDVKWTLERLKSKDCVHFRGLFEPFVGAEIIDDYTIDIKTRKPYALLLNMATYIFPMDSRFYSGTDENGRSKGAIVKFGSSFAQKNESGTGPFKVTFHERGVKTVFDRVADYWDIQSDGNVSNIVLTPIRNNATRVSALLSGDVDFISPVPLQDYKRIKRDRNCKLVAMNGGRIITLQLNQQRQPAFKDVRVRQAIVYATDNTGIVDEMMKEAATVAAQQSPEGYAGHNKSLRPRYDLKKARRLMRESGYERGFECTMIAPNNRYVNDARIARAFVSMMAKINIKVNLKTMPKAQYWDQFDAKTADIQMIGWRSDTDDSGNFTEYLLMTHDLRTGYGQYNSGGYSNKRVDELTMAAQTETDLAKRAGMLQEVEQILYDDAAFVPFHWQSLVWASKKGVQIEKIVNSQNFPYFGDLVVE